MAKVIVSLNAANNQVAIRNFYDDEAIADRAIDAINCAFVLLISHPEAGRPVPSRSQMRERVICFGTTGFVALYHFDKQKDEVVILSIRHQREAGYRDALEPRSW